MGVFLCDPRWVRFNILHWTSPCPQSRVGRCWTLFLMSARACWKEEWPGAWNPKQWRSSCLWWISPIEATNIELSSNAVIVHNWLQRILNPFNTEIERDEAQHSIEYRRVVEGLNANSGKVEPLKLGSCIALISDNMFRV